MFAPSVGNYAHLAFGVGARHGVGAIQPRGQCQACSPSQGVGSSHALHRVGAGQAIGSAPACPGIGASNGSTPNCHRVGASGSWGQRRVDMGSASRPVVPGQPCGLLAPKWRSAPAPPLGPLAAPSGNVRMRPAQRFESAKARALRCAALGRFVARPRSSRATRVPLGRRPGVVRQPPQSYRTLDRRTPRKVTIPTKHSELPEVALVATTWPTVIAFGRCGQRLSIVGQLCRKFGQSPTNMDQC